MRLTRFALAVAVAVLALAGCSSGKKQAAVPETATGSLESLAAQAKCKPAIQTDADEIRQAICKNAAGRFILATFTTDRGQREWTNGAEDYGGYFLVGRKWTAVGDMKVVAALRQRLGGTLEEGDTMKGMSGMPSAQHNG
ncbi:hypothetical protein [Streptomyces sp. CdTB01]|uniref:hypothetical protein n=1 Tax=Streptomyces sp. CdTB01 TaxID=1725411 RepID=UPI00073AB172|nr:hypothetical protein [Streptomyces sp. CdTB01]ALV39217.1 hypothetical protein AS200_44785 [Streptomyces sp. CdTB01]